MIRDALFPALSCSDPPPPPEGAHLPLGEVAVLSLTDPEEVKCVLLSLYTRIHLQLTLTVPVARGIMHNHLHNDDLFDDAFLHEELWN
jgi:hypothetical protein